MDADAEPIRCELSMNPDCDVEVVPHEGCGLPDAIDRCRVLIGRAERAHRITIQAARSG